jgi:hypothetical protein
LHRIDEPELGSLVAASDGCHRQLLPHAGLELVKARSWPDL